MDEEMGSGGSTCDSDCNIIEPLARHSRMFGQVSRTRFSLPLFGSTWALGGRVRFCGR